MTTYGFNEVSCSVCGAATNQEPASTNSLRFHRSENPLRGIRETPSRRRRANYAIEMVLDPQSDQFSDADPQ